MSERHVWPPESPQVGFWRIFWPAILGWATPSALIGLDAIGWLPCFGRQAYSWIDVVFWIGVFGAPLGALYVTARHRGARTCGALAANFSTFLLAGGVILLGHIAAMG